MSDSPPRLPPRASLEQLRKQAKDKLHAMRSADPGAALHDAQLALAREYGFDSWPNLVHHVAATQPGSRTGMFEQLAADFLDGYHGDENALRRLGALFGTSYNTEQLRVRVQDSLNGLRPAGAPAHPFTRDEARLFVARHHRFETWEELTRSEPPFYRLDADGNLEPGLIVSARDWDVIFDVMQELKITGLKLGGRASDTVLARLPALEYLTRLDLGGATRITDDGVLTLAAMPWLEHLDLGGWHSPITDRGLEVLRHLPALKTFAMCWPQRVTDAGAANLTYCDQLEDVNLMGTNTGDGAINALAGKKRLRKFSTGRAVTDRGIPLLHQFPMFKTWHGGAIRYGIMAFGAGPTQLMLDGPFSDAGLARVAGLDGLFGLNLFWHVSGLTGEGIRHLAGLPRLGVLGVDGNLCNDVAMRHVAAIPDLRMLMAQGTVATDAGFAALSRSRSIEYLWGRECPNLTGDGFRALASMPALRGLAVSCRRVDDAALGLLPSFPSLRELLPMDVSDDGFRHVGRCEALERLWCMYCRDTGDEATRHIAGLKLRTYYAGKTKITDASLEILARMESLEEIELWETAGVTNRGVAALAALPKLRKLDIGGAPHVTRAGVAGFPSRVKVDI